MAVREGFTSTDPFSGSLANRMRIPVPATYPRRFLAWCVILLAGLVVGRFFACAHHSQPDMLVLTWMRGLGGTAAFGAAVYSFGRFVLGKEFRMLWTAAAFSALAGGSLLQTVADLGAGNSPIHAIISTSAWLVASVFFLCAALSRFTWRVGTRKEAVGMAAAGAVVVAAIPLAVAPYAFDTSLLVKINSSANGALMLHFADCAAQVFAPILMAFAVLGCYRRLRDENDRIAGIVCYFLAACLAGLIGLLFSSARFDEWWNTGHWMIALAWVVLVAGVEMEMAFSHKEAGERVAELETLHQVSWSLVGAGTTGELLDQFTRTLVGELDARVAAVYTAVDNGQKLELAAICGLNGDSPPIGTAYAAVSQERRPGFHTGHTAKAFTSTEVQIASDIFVDVEFVPWKMIAQDDGCAASIPLVNHGNSIGVMNLYFGSSKQLTRQRLKLFATIAAAAAPAIESALARDRFADIQDNQKDISPLAA